MRIHLYVGLIIALSGTALAQSAAPDVSSLQAAPAASVTNLIASAAGHGLTLTECVDRLEHLGAFLRDRGYGSRRDEQLEPGVLVTLWSRPGTHTAVVAWISDQGAAHDLEVAEFAWDHPWNEWLTPF